MKYSVDHSEGIFRGDTPDISISGPVFLMAGAIPIQISCVPETAAAN